LTQKPPPRPHEPSKQVTPISNQVIPTKDDHRSVKILLVEDDVIIRQSTTDMLEAFGHHVLTATSAAEALHILKSNDVEVLVTDIGLPGISGHELASQAKAAKPSLVVVFASGYEALPMENRTIDGEGILLRKPYDQHIASKSAQRKS
jgi:CheY-like chemotaxis protein